MRMRPSTSLGTNGWVPVRLNLPEFPSEVEGRAQNGFGYLRHPLAPSRGKWVRAKTRSRV